MSSTPSIPTIQPEAAAVDVTSSTDASSPTNSASGAAPATEPAADVVPARVRTWGSFTWGDGRVWNDATTTVKNGEQ